MFGGFHIVMSRLGACVLDIQREARGRQPEGEGARDSQEEEQGQHPGTQIDL